jgi:hypothetical protein
MLGTFTLLATHLVLEGLAHEAHDVGGADFEQGQQRRIDGPQATSPALITIERCCKVDSRGSDFGNDMLVSLVIRFDSHDQAHQRLL